MARTQAEIARARRSSEREAALKRLLGALGTSHTEYIPRSEPKYWELTSVLERIFPAFPDQCPDIANTLPPLPITWANIGVFWKQIGGGWFVAGVFDDGPAKTAGLRLGDEVIAADGAAFDRVASFRDKAGRAVQLTYRREHGGASATVSIKPELRQPADAFKTALRTSARVIEQRGKRVGYVHVWSWAGDDVQSELRDAINKLNQARPDAFVLDIRDGWGGASPEYLANW